MTDSFHDLPIEERLSLARRGTAHYSGQLALLENDEFSESTALEGWTRNHLIAHVGYNAAAVSNLMHWATTGEETPMYESPKARGEEIEYGATLNADALRNLHDHTVARLDVAWRDAPEAAWTAEVLTAQGRTVPAAETLWMRSREVWIHAVDLGVHATFSDIPEVVLNTLLHEIPGKWRGNGAGAGLVLVNDTTGERIEVSPADDANPLTEIHGDLPGLVRWTAGRDARGVTSPQGEVPEPPRWL
ncbi:maleylpyruvate isomerase family mycothiol-dependent enzyme [Corynebacterium sp. A21]|uniref:maleylpyruvate isomerase family mycothiol-dependent enzyme n=1 Tax=Corynebacterium sp. A21 TaxID=3457318 RepID=UPI003FD57FFD